jgi:hypothetical protein
MAFGMDSLTTTLGVTMFFRGIGSAIGPIVTGIIYDAAKSYDYACYLGGGILFLGGVVNQISHKLLSKQQEQRVEIARTFGIDLETVAKDDVNITNIRRFSIAM